METLLESDREEQLRDGEQEEVEEQLRDGEQDEVEEQLREGEQEEVEDRDRELKETLTNLHVSAPSTTLKLDEADELHPESYRVNSPDEIRLLAIADHFQRQYSHVFPSRKPLLLCPVNECGVKKFVSTTLRPTPTVHPELHTWGGCASFVADFLSLDPLDPPVDPPRYLFSPPSVLRRQRATCFEYAALLCSLLLGANYDAYCVSGYAVKEMCLLDQSLQQCPLLDQSLQQCPLLDQSLQQCPLLDQSLQQCPLLDQSLQRCPLLDTQVTSVISEQGPQESKYTVKPPRELKSHFLTQQDEKERDAGAALLHRQELQQESERQLADPLRGLRVHCWVLVLSGSRSVRENFFIDPLTGNSYAPDHENFLGVESVWNNYNYYVNMQDCRTGCVDVVYDLEDLKMWEPVLYGATSKKQLMSEVSKRKERKMRRTFSDDEEEEEQHRAFNMPRSWVHYITIQKKDLETRWPGGQEGTRYRRAQLERFAPYLRPDGLTTRLTTYKDLDCTEVVMVKEWYQHRNDSLEEREINEADDSTAERFRRGGRFGLSFHRCTSLGSGTEREMEFSGARVDHLVRRVESPREMTEFFEGRGDLLHYRHAHFSEPDLDIEKVVERFHRDRSKPANGDVAQRVFLLAQRRIELTYHLEDHRLIPSKRSFIKPQESTENKKAEDFTSDMESSFQVQVDPSEKPLKTLALYDMLVALMKEEEKVVLQIKASKQEVRDIVVHREQEERDVQLQFSPWTTTGAAMARRQRQEMEHLAAEEQRWLQEKEKDILAPLLIRLDNAETLSAEDAKRVHRDCLAEFKQRLVEHANLIQERYEKETGDLQSRQQWYQRNQLGITRPQEDEYQAYCHEKTLRINVARKRLSMHKEAAPQRYQTLDQKLKRDPRLAPHLLTF